MIKRIVACALALLASTFAFGVTYVPVQLINSAGSTNGQTIVSTGSTSSPAWGNVSAAALIGILPVANGGTNASSAGGTALDNISGFSGTGFLTRTGAGTYAFQSATNGITLGNLAQTAANTVLANGTGSTANIAAFSMPSCSTSVSALNWTSGAGFTCNTGLITASTVSSTYAPLSSPALTGTPTAPTQGNASNSTAIATTAFGYGLLASGLAPASVTTLAASGTVSGAGFTTLLSPYAPLASPALNGTPTAPTASAGTSTTQLATTQFAQTAVTGGSNAGSFTSVAHSQQEVDKSYTVSSPATGGTVTIAAGTETALIVPAGSLSTLTVTLPGCTSGYDGSVERFVSTQAVTTLTLNASSGSVVDPVTSLTIGVGHAYLCRGAATAWYPLY